MKGLIMHSPASATSTFWRWVAAALITLVIVISPSTSAPAAARTTGKVKAVTHKRTKKSVASGKQAKRIGTRRAARVIHRGDPTKLVLPPTEPSRVIDVAAQYLGRPYRFGSSVGAYDCSGFVRRVFEEIGVDLPHSARGQFSLGDSVHRTELTVGDLVFFRTYRRGASHVGIYVGDDKFIHAATRGGQVQVDSLTQRYYAARYVGARRIDTDS